MLACPACGRLLGSTTGIGRGVTAETTVKVAARRQTRLHALGIAAGDASASAGVTQARPVKDVLARDLTLEVDALPFVNYALHHGGFPGMARISLLNRGFEMSQNLMVRAVLSPDAFGDAWEINIPELAAGQTWEGDVVLPLDATKLRAVTEKHHAFMKVTVADRHETLATQMSPIDVLAYNEWLFVPELLFMLAAFVQSNDGSLHGVVAQAAERLKATTGSAAFAGYQAGGPQRVLAMLSALHVALHEDAGLNYINPPPSFERTGQKIRLVADTLRQKRGTCLDLAVLQAALWEHVGLRPAIIIIPGHAMLGCWLQDDESTAPVIALHEDGDDSGRLFDAAAQGRWAVFNSTEVANGLDLQAASENGARLLGEALEAEEGHAFVIDIHACRSQVTPLP